MTAIDPVQILKNIEAAGRTCYKSEDKITEDSAGKFVQMILSRGHESVLEHQSISVKFICGVSHEIVRHRNLCLLEFEECHHINAHFSSIDDGEHVKPL
jgi:thymidylate synthase (FAD)